MTTELFSTRDLARALFFRAKKQWVEYLAECEEDRKNGFRPSHCRHGVSMWVDYDCACGMCETYGNYWSDAEEWAQAKQEATEMHERAVKRWDIYITLMAQDAPVEGRLKDWLQLPVRHVVDLIRRYN